MVKFIVHTSTCIVSKSQCTCTSTILTVASQTDIKEESMPYTDLAEKEVISPREKAFTDSRLVEQRLLYEEQLKEFKFSDRASISFPNTLSSSSRKLIHEVSGILLFNVSIRFLGAAVRAVGIGTCQSC